jgi:cell division protein FtsB
MKSEKQNEAQQVKEKSHVQQAISIATVVASLGTSLGVGVTNLIAAEKPLPVRGEAVQMKGDFGNINSSQIKLSEQIKLFESSQIKFWNQIKGESPKGKFDARQYKELQANEHKLADQINNLQANEYKLSTQFKFWQANMHKGADQIKFDGLVANEHKLANQINTLEANQHKLADQIKLLQSKQLKY